MRVKDASVNRTVMTPEMLEAETVADVLCRALGHDCICTSANDGHHGDHSLHYQNQARDFRTHHMPPMDKTVFKNFVKKALGSSYDVLIEDLGGPNEHLHVEFDPK